MARWKMHHGHLSHAPRASNALEFKLYTKREESGTETEIRLVKTPKFCRPMAAPRATWLSLQRGSQGTPPASSTERLDLGFLILQRVRSPHGDLVRVAMRHAPSAEGH